MENSSSRGEELTGEDSRAYGAMFNSYPVMMHLSDMKGDIVSVNGRWLATFGYSGEEVIGTPSAGYLTEASRELAKSLLPELLRTGMIVDIEAQAVTKSGEVLDILVGSNVMSDGEGRPYRFMTTLIDITKRKRAEEALRTRESYLTAILENLPGLVWLKDAESRFLAVNRAFARSGGGRNPEDLIGRTDFDVWPPELAKKYRTDDLAIMKSGVAARLEEYIADQGKRRWFETFKTPVRNSQGEIIGTTGYAQDITARKLEEEALNNVQKLESLGILAGGIAHDFNNLLSGIFGCIELGIQLSTERDVTETLSTALGAIDRARGLTQQLLTFAKGGAPIKKVEHLVPFVQDIAKFALSGSNVSCEVHFPTDLWPCEFDKNQIAQVLDNIIINAAQAMPGGGTIQLRGENVVVKGKTGCATLKNGHYVKVSVTDHGVGILPELLPRIFDPFFSTKASGHGLGLSTSYSIINRHGGCIEVESEPGNGSTFHVYLPAVTGNHRDPETTGTATLVKTGTIIIMDDEAVIRFTVSRMLGSLGYATLTAQNGTEAINLLRSELHEGRHVEAMILDLTIAGGMGGKEAIVEIRRIAPDLTVLVASGYADDPVMASPALFGFTDSICKPFGISELSGLLQKYCREKR